MNHIHMLWSLTSGVQAIICYIILPVWVYLAKKMSTASKKAIHFLFPLLWPLLQLYHSHSVRWDHYYMSCPGRLFSCGVCSFEAINQRSDLVRVGPFPNYSWKRWDQFLKQHSVSGKNYLVKSCNISWIFYKTALCRKAWEQTDWKVESEQMP